MQIGAVLSQSWDLYKKFLKEFFLTALLVFFVLDLLSAVATTAAGGSTGSRAFWSLIAFAVGIVGYFWVAAALVVRGGVGRHGRADRSVTETYRAVQPHLVAVIIAGLLAGIGIAVGLIFLIVPGLILLTIWSMLVPVIVIEGKSAGESFGRSREVVRGNGWNVFGLILLTFLLVAIASGLIQLLFKPLPDFLDAWLGSLVAHSLTVPFAAATLTTAYFTLTASRSEAAEPDPAPSPAAP
jgi:hypothetical protein